MAVAEALLSWPGKAAPFGPLACALLPDLAGLQHQGFLDNEFGAPVLRTLNAVFATRANTRLRRGSHQIIIRGLAIDHSCHHTLVIDFEHAGVRARLRASLFTMSLKAQRSLEDPEEERSGPSRGDATKRKVSAPRSY